MSSSKVADFMDDRLHRKYRLSQLPIITNLQYVSSLVAKLTLTIFKTMIQSIISVYEALQFMVLLSE